MSGERGPKSKPGNVHLLNGNPSRKAIGSLFRDELRPPVEIPDMPAHLTGEAAAEWERIAPFLQKLGLVAEIDRAALAIYCSAWAEYRWAEERIAALNLDDPTAEAGRVMNTPSGYKQISVVLQVRNRAIEVCAKFLAMFGMSPSDRSRVTPSDLQLPLEGVDPLSKHGWASYQKT